MEVKEGCGSCGSTGLYRGFAEQPGEAVVCLTCNGEGFHLKDEGDVAPNRIVEGRKHRTDVKKVRRSQGALVAFGVGPTGRHITYEQFWSGAKP